MLFIPFLDNSFGEMTKAFLNQLQHFFFISFFFIFLFIFISVTFEQKIWGNLFFKSFGFRHVSPPLTYFLNLIILNLINGRTYVWFEPGVINGRTYMLISHKA